jgi:hypothetical protein
MLWIDVHRFGDGAGCRPEAPLRGDRWRHSAVNAKNGFMKLQVWATRQR